MKKTPMQVVKDEFGSKQALADKLMDVLERHGEETTDEFKSRISTTSNRKLLRLWHANEKLNKDFGSREKLIDAIMTLKFDGRPEEAYRTRISSYATTRLLDLHGMVKRASERKAD